MFSYAICIGNNQLFIDILMPFVITHQLKPLAKVERQQSLVKYTYGLLYL